MMGGFRRQGTALAAVLLACSAASPPTSTLLANNMQLINFLIQDARTGAMSGDAPYPNNTATCKWPQCAPDCNPCKKTSSLTSCTTSNPLTCPSQSQCLQGNCFAQPGLCFAPAAVVQFAPRQCFLGAKPPPVEQTEDQRRFLNLAPPLPSQTAQLEEWGQWLKGCGKAPLAIAITGFLVAFFTFCCLCSHCTCRCKCLPKSPVVLITLCIACVLICTGGVVYRLLVVSQSVDVARVQLETALELFESTLASLDTLKASKDTLNVTASAVPGSCNPFDPLTKALVTNQVNDMLGKMAMLTSAIDVMHHTLSTTITVLHLAVDRYWSPFAFAVKWMPVLPIILMQGGILIIAIAALISWCSRRRQLVRCADVCILQFGSVGIALLIVIAAIMSASTLFIGTAVSGVCSDIDSNLINFASQVNFTKLTKEEFHMSQLVTSTAMYYIAGTRENPLHTLFDNAEAAMNSVMSTYTKKLMLINIAKTSCPGVANLSPQAMVDSGIALIELGRRHTHAARIWPLYDVLVHDNLCRSTPRELYLLVIFTTLASLVFYPALAILADFDLRKWAEHKEKHQPGYGDSDDDDDTELQLLDE